MCLHVGSGAQVECTLQMTEWSKEPQRAVLWTRTGILEVSTLLCPALASSSGPLWTVHNHILEEPPKQKNRWKKCLVSLFQMA